MVDKAIESKENAVPEKDALEAAPKTSTKLPEKTYDQPPAKTAPTMPQPASKGEKAYNWIVYSGVNYWINLGSSIVIADYFCNLKGKDLINKGADKLAKAFSSNAAGQHKIFHNSQTALKTLSLLSGGWLLIIPMKIMEDNKRPMVHWLNKKMGVEQRDADGKELTSDQIYIECEQPHHSWFNTILRRTAATAAVVGTGHVVNAAFRDREKSKTYTGQDDPHGGKAVVEKFVVDNVNKAMKSGYIPGGKAFTESPTAQRYLGLAALDTVFTKITAVIMRATNGSKKGRMPNEQGDDQAPHVDTRVQDEITYKTDTKTTESEKKTDYAARVSAEKTAKGPITPESLKKKPIKEAANFMAHADKGDATPEMTRG